MADNFVTNATTTTGTTFASDELAASVHVQRVKMTYGADGVMTDVNDTTPLPIDDAGSSLTVDNAAHDSLNCNANIQVANTDAASSNRVPVELFDSNGDSATDDANNAIRVNVVAGVSGGTSEPDSSAFLSGIDSGTPIMGLHDVTGPNVLAEDEVGVIRCTEDRELYTVIRDGAGNTRSANVDANNHLEVQNDVLDVVGNGGQATAQRVTIANDSSGVLTVFQSAHDVLNCNANIQVGNTDASSSNRVPSQLFDGGGVSAMDDANNAVRVNLVAGAGGSSAVDSNPFTVTTDSGTPMMGLYDPAPLADTLLANDAGVLRCSADRELLVEVAQALPAGTNNIGDVDVLTLPNVVIAGDLAHDAPETSNPVSIAGTSVEFAATPTAVVAGDRTALNTDRHGSLFTIGGSPNVIARSALVTSALGAQTDRVLVAVAINFVAVVTRVSVLTDNETTVDVGVQVGFGATMPTRAAGGVDGIMIDHPGVPAGGGITVGDGSGIIGVGGDGEDIIYDCEAPTGGNCVVSISYYLVAH